MAEEKKILIPGRLKNAAVGGHVAGTEDIYDATIGKTQEQINGEVEDSTEDLDTRLNVVEQLADISVAGGEIGIATANDLKNRTTAGDAKIPTVAAVMDSADDTPTEGSSKWVTSGGVYTALQQAQESMNLVKDETLEENRQMVNSLLEDYRPIVIEGDVSNAPDEEDLASINVEGTNILKFKDKPYNPLVFSGLGKKILRKNIVSGQNVLTQDIMSNSNTLYLIQYDFDLSGNTIEIPEGCVLEFDGGSIRNGVIIFNNTTITNDKIYQVFYDIEFQGTVLNDALNVVLFGIIPDNDNIDATPILHKIESYTGKIFFPAGNYYFSEYHYVPKGSNGKFVIYGSNDNTLHGKTIFRPYYSSQRYIMKIGGNSATDITFNNCAYDITLMYIAFSTPQGYQPVEMGIPNGREDIEYKHAALVLDAVQIGKFGINGDTHNTPLLMMNYVNECTFDYITCYTTFGKSSLPVINIITGNERTITATKINRLECETISGPVITGTSGSTISELYINTFNYEGTKMFGSNRENLQDEQRYTSLIDYSEYKCVPILDLQGIGINIYINYTSITGSNNTWVNTLDNDLSRRCVTTLVNTTGYNGQLTFNTIENNHASRYLCVTGGTSQMVSDLITINKAKGITIVPKSDTNNKLNISISDEYYYDNVSPVFIKNKEYKGNDLRKISKTILDTNRNTVGRICSIVKNGENLTTYSNNSASNTYIINDCGFVLDKDTNYIKLTFYVEANYPSFKYSFEYYVSGDSQPVYTDTIEKQVVSNVSTSFVYKINKDIVFDYIKIKKISSGYSSFVSSIIFSNLLKENADNYANIHRETEIRKVISDIIILSSNTAKIIDNPFETGSKCFVENLLYVNGPITVKFLKENDFSSTDEPITFTIAQKVDIINIFTPDKTVYKFFGFKTASGGAKLQYGNYVLSDVEYDGAKIGIRRYGFDHSTYSSFSLRPSSNNIFIGFEYLDLTLNRINHWNGSKWVEADGAKGGIKRSGTFAQKPVADDIYVGFRYFCTDKQTVEGAVNGIEITHKGSNVWVDALGRVVS